MRSQSSSGCVDADTDNVADANGRRSVTSRGSRRGRSLMYLESVLPMKVISST
jgi:hypothetical protein